MARSLELYLVRHGIAEERGPKWPDDTRRPLTAKGAERFEDVVRGLSALGVELDVVLTSPLVRARQTADLLASGLNPHPPVRSTPALAPGASHSAWLGAMADLATKVSRVACVGHEPDLGQLAARVLGAKRALIFKKGGVCRIDLDSLSSTGTLVWFAPPRLLRSAAG